LLSLQPLDLLGGGDCDIAGAKCLSADCNRLLERPLFELSELLTPGDELLTTLQEVGASVGCRSRKPLAFRNLARQGLRSIPNDGECGIKEDADLDQLVRACTIGKGKQRWATRHHGEAGKKG
jgi:hypothetical protein